MTATRPQRNSALTSSDVLVWLSVFIVYLTTALIGLRFGAVSGFASLVWPPTGIAVAAAVLFGRKTWSAIFLAAFLTNAITGAPLLAAVCIGLGNMLEAMVASVLLARYAFHPSLHRIRDVALLIVCGGICGPIVSATVGVSALALSGTVAAAAFGSTWAAWAVGDALGAIVVAPCILTLSRRETRPWSREKILEAVALFAVFFLSDRTVFFTHSPIPLAPAVLLPVLTWAAIRFESRVTSFLVLLTAFSAVVGTWAGYGIFHETASTNALYGVQLAIGAITTTQFFLMAALTERREAAEGLAVLNNSLEGIVQKQTKELVLQKETAEAAIESIGEGVLMVDNVGTLLRMNTRAAELLGVDRKEYFDQPYERLWKAEKDGKPLHECAMRVTAATGQAVEIVRVDGYTAVRPDGKRFPVSLTTTPVLLHDELIGIILVFRDVSYE